MNTFFLLSLVSCIGAKNVDQPKRLQAAKLRDNVTLECYLPKTDFNNMVWYKQEMGNTLQPISRCYNYLKKADFFHGFNDKRFTVTIKKEIFHLHISMTKTEDTATYFCGVITLGELTLGPGTFLMITGEELSSRSILQEPILDEVHPGDNITFMCRVKTAEEKCAGGYKTHWFREGSEESLPAVIYTDGEMKKQCEESSDGFSTQNCMYSLTKTNLSLSDAGIYYCAVSACNKIMFGNGTNLEISLVHDTSFTTTVFNPWFLILVLSNVISIIIMISLLALQCKGQNSSSDCVSQSSNHETIAAQVGNTETLTYSSVSFTGNLRPSRGAEQQNYSQVYSKIRS